MQHQPAAIDFGAKSMLMRSRTLVGVRSWRRSFCRSRISRTSSAVILLVQFIVQILQIFCELVEDPFHARRRERSVLLARYLAAICDGRTRRSRGIDGHIRRA